jgi:2-succinyl-5-enolpyruvyl-6-hydroxy-3-cyclohexene-1-carboxylate synthase
VNRELSEALLGGLRALGVREWCACAGARNSPLFVALLESGAKVHRFYEERSAAFFALGRIQRDGAPVAVLTTSGTAAAELLPAMIEAHYTQLPLVAVTADRPRRYRGTGAPQSIEQVGLFGPYAAASFDLAAGEAVPDARLPAGPLHFNVCFEEPLLDVADRPTPAPHFTRTSDDFDYAAASQALEKFLAGARRPVILVGPLAENERASVARFVDEVGAPVLTESASGLRGQLRFEFHAGERFVKFLEPDGILRLGGVPTCRLWRDLEQSLSHLEVLSFSRAPFAGLTRGAFHCLPLDARLGEMARPSAWSASELAAFVARDRERRAEVESLLEAEPQSEPGMLRALSRLVPAGAPLYLGNSLPIREWDLAAVPRAWGPVGVNRGANGIDGQLSTFLGFARSTGDNWAVLGDLTTLYDLGAPWILEQLGALRFTLAIVNNGGGAIFSRMFARPEFQNPHTTRFGHWAAMWNLRHEEWTRVPSAFAPTGADVLELLPDRAATDRFWRGYDAVWAR